MNLINEVAQWAVLAVFLILLFTYVRNHATKVKGELASTEASVRRNLADMELKGRNALTQAEAEARRVIADAQADAAAALETAREKARELLAEAQAKLDQLRQ